MIIKGLADSALHVNKIEDIGKYIVLVEKKFAEGFHKSAKLIVDNVRSYDDGTHSMEISGAHYAICPEIDFFPMARRIAKSRSYRRYKQTINLQGLKSAA